MFKLSLLQFLSLSDIFKFTNVCKEIKMIVDPLECYKDSQITNYKHLKLIASMHLLETKDLQPTLSQIDDRFGIDIKRVRDFSYLNGKIFRDTLIDMYTKEVDLSGF